MFKLEDKFSMPRMPSFENEPSGKVNHWLCVGLAAMTCVALYIGGEALDAKKEVASLKKELSSIQHSQSEKIEDYSEVEILTRDQKIKELEEINSTLIEELDDYQNIESEQALKITILQSDLDKVKGDKALLSSRLKSVIHEKDVLFNHVNK